MIQFREIQYYSHRHEVRKLTHKKRIREKADVCLYIV